MKKLLNYRARMCFFILQGHFLDFVYIKGSISTTNP